MPIKKFVPDKKINFALQNGPLIIEPGGKKGIFYSGGEAERTILALDKRGKVHLFIIKTPTSLFECQDLLLNKVKDIYAAINLDGGPSTFLFIKMNGKSSSFGSPAGLPYLIKVTPK